VGTTEITYSGHFATITPDNCAAASAFGNVVAFLENREVSLPSAEAGVTEPYHTRFLSLPVPSSEKTGLIPPSDDALDEGPGRYLLSLDVLPEGPGAAWRFGRGDARLRNHSGDQDGGVDILLVPPQQHKGVANVHGMIYIHRRSGSLMLRSTSSHPMRYLSAAPDGKDLVLRSGDQTVIYKTANRLRIGELDYLLTIHVEHEGHFETLRNQFISTILEEPALPHPKLDPIPKPYHQKMGGYVMHRTISAGAFGVVRSGVSSKSGDPVAIKRLSRKGNPSAIETEIRIARIFTPAENGMDGVIPILSAWCEHGSPSPCGDAFEDFFVAMPLARTDFAHASWESMPMTTRLKLFWHTLVGLSRIHAAGVMHRDISAKNLLIQSFDPPIAAICDFGKATQKVQSTYTAIGPIETVAPEVWSAAAQGYGPVVDVWSLGYAWLTTYGSLRHVFSSQRDHKTDEGRARRIRVELEKRVRADETGIPRALADLLGRMLEFQPARRYTAAQALQHHVWRDLTRPSDSGEEKEAKRRRLLTPEPEPSGTSPIPDTEVSPTSTLPLGARGS